MLFVGPLLCYDSSFLVTTSYDMTPVLGLFAISPLALTTVVPFSFRPSTQRRLAKGLSPPDKNVLERRNGVR